MYCCATALLLQYSTATKPSFTSHAWMLSARPFEILTAGNASFQSILCVLLDSLCRGLSLVPSHVLTSFTAAPVESAQFAVLRFSLGLGLGL